MNAEGQLYSRVTASGTAMSEATLCGDHLAGHSEAFDPIADAAPDAAEHRVWIDTSGNDAIECQVCGRTNDSDAAQAVARDAAGLAPRDSFDHRR